jgi:hypothetical protein
MDKNKQVILRIGEAIQSLVSDLHIKNPDNKTFEQQGFLDGLSIVKEYLAEDEYEIAIEHLIYMVCESDISYPPELIKDL